MSRPLLFVTALFYTLLGIAFFFAPVHALSITRSTFESFVNSQYTKEGIGCVLTIAGLFSFASLYWYYHARLRVLASATRAGSMSSVFLLVLLVFLLLPTGSLTAVIIFGYLTALSYMTLTPPIEPVREALRVVEETRRQTAIDTSARLDSLEAIHRVPDTPDTPQP